MSELFEKSIRTLELPRVLQMLSDQAVSDEAKRRCLALRPQTDADEVETAAGPDRRGPGPAGPAGQPSFSGCARWRRAWTGRTGAAGSTPGSC
jgi:DNA mismatch repair protein MutS2